MLTPIYTLISIPKRRLKMEWGQRENSYGKGQNFVIVADTAVVYTCTWLPPSLFRTGPPVYVAWWAGTTTPFLHDS